MTFVPEMYERDVDVVRLCEYIVFSLSRLRKDSPECAKVTRLLAILKKFPPEVVGKIGFTRSAILTPVIGMCVGFWMQRQDEAVTRLRGTTGYSLALLDTMREVFAECETKHECSDTARLNFEAFLTRARELGEATAPDAGDDMDEDNLCSICYACPIDTRYVPCGHVSCRLCAERQMLQNPTCPLCRAHIDSLVCHLFHSQSSTRFFHPVVCLLFLHRNTLMLRYHRHQRRQRYQSHQSHQRCQSHQRRKRHQRHRRHRPRCHEQAFFFLHNFSTAA